MILLTSLVSAAQFDNVKDIINTHNPNAATIGDKNVQWNDLWEKYPPVVVENWGGIGKKLFEGAITKHTESCSSDCASVMEIYTSGDDTLIDEVIFVGGNVKSYKLEYLFSTEIVTEDIKDYQNGQWVKVAEESREVETWTDFNEGDIFPEGNYKIRITGDKNPYEVIDWQIRTNGELISEWAVWGGQDLTQDLQAYWNLDETSGTAIYDWKGVNNGSNIGGALVNQPAILGTGYYLNGINAYLNFHQNSSIVMTEALTFNMWINMSKNPVVETYLLSASENDYELSISSTGVLSYIVEGVGGPTGHTITLNQWDMITYMVNDTGFYLYVDGSYVNSGVANDLAGTTNDLFFGARSPGLANNKYNGTVDEITIWNRTLTASEITYLYNSGAGNLPISSGTVTLNSPSNASVDGDGLVTFNATASVGGTTLTNMSLWTNKSGTWAITNTTTGLSGTTHTQIWDLSFADGTYIWNVQACDSDGDCGFATSNFTVSLDATPPSVTIDYPTSSIPTLTNGEVVDLNTTITDTNLDSCWYSYNGVNTTIPSCADYNFTYATGVNTITVFANDTIGNLGSASVSWSIDLQENSQTFDATAIEFSEETFVANVTYNSTKFNIATGTLYYNGASYSGTKAGSGDTVTFTRTITVPDVTVAENKTFYWNIALTNSSGTFYFNLTSYNQTVSPINMSLCGSPHTVPFINFTVYDEETLNVLNSTFEGTFTYSGVGSTNTNTFSYSDKTNSTSEFDFCLDPSTETYELDTTIEVGATGYVTKFYNWENLVITNTTLEQPLYLLATGDSTSFIIQVIDVGASPQVGLEVEVQRYSTGSGTWLTTEVVTTNYEGKAIGHLVSEDVDYRFRVYDAGVSVYNSTSTKIACEATPCTVTLVIPGNIDNGLEGLSDLTTSLTYNENTNVFTFTYQDGSSAFSKGNLTVNRWNPGNATDNAQVCTTASTSSSAVLTCDISSEVNGTYVARGYIIRTDSGTNLVEKLYGYLGDTIYNKVGNEGVLWAFFLFIGIVMLGVARPSLGVIAGIGGTLALSFLNIISIGWTALIAVTAIGIIILIQVKRE